ncbi:MAG: hypothetical protein EA397_01415 [Deltaproteobacteria bacterium]|nr:MAG: hypothetical protein EA397_01415 [Deltaproteobacteria bacterium]
MWIARSAAWIALSASALLSTACGPVPDQGEGLLGTGPAAPFPSVFQLDDEGFVDLKGLPRYDGMEVDVGRTAWRRGFSPAQVSIVHLEGLDAQDLPSWRSPTPGQGPVRLLDLTEGTWLPVMAELDANAPPAEASLLIRPLQALPPEHRVAVVLTTEATPRPERFDALLSRRPPQSIAHLRDHFRELVASIEQAGLPEGEIALAWDFPIEDALRPTRSAVASLQGFTSQITWDELRVDDQADGDGWRTAIGRFTVPSVLDEEGYLRLEPDGSVTSEGEVSFDLWVHVPESVRGAPPGTVPVVIFGHGIFGASEFYLGGSSRSAVHRVAEEGGVIMVATRFTGLSRPDLGLALSVANDMTRMPLLTEQLVQAQVGLRGLAELVASGELLDEPVFQAESGGSLARDEDPAYYGISLGGIQGSVAISLGLPVASAVLHVGGSMWSTMLERSSNFVAFDGIVRNKMPDPSEMALMIAWTQLHWDLVDPYAGAHALDGVNVLLQEALLDEQVPNLTTRALARSAGMAAVGPMVEPPWGLEQVAAPARVGPAYTQFDPELEGAPDVNRPAFETGAHGGPRRWPGVRAQTVHFLHPDTQGEVIHGCGEAPCTDSNRGTAD